MGIAPRRYTEIGLFKSCLYTSDRIRTTKLTLLWCSGIPNARQGVALVHFSAQPEPFLSLNPVQRPTVPHTKCTRRAEKWTSVRGFYSYTSQLNLSRLFH